MNFENVKLDWRLALVLLFILFSLLYGLFLLFIPKQNRPQEPQSNSQIPTQTSQNPVYVITTPPLTKTIPLITNTYSIHYPNNWIVTNGKSALGEIITIQPPLLPPGVSDPIIMIETRHQSNTIDTINRFYEKKDFQKSNITLGGISISKIYGTNSYKIISGKPILSPIQETYLLFKKGGDEYVIRYSYDGNKPTPEYEEIFTEILKTIKFKQ